jgi:hypothetical protein
MAIGVYTSGKSKKSRSLWTKLARGRIGNELASFRKREPMKLGVNVLLHQSLPEASFLGFDPPQREGEENV